MRLFGLNSYHSALEIRDFSKHNRINKNQSEIRGAVKIAVIDDEKFHAYGNLRSYGYDITELPDITSINQIAKFDIILCDLMGVGSSFDKAKGGASIIKEIKLNFPTKFVIAYTGARASTTEAMAAKEHCDHFMKKDAPLSEWTEILDEYVRQALNPYEMWLITRDGLLDIELDLRDILKLESAYVEAILARDSKFNNLKRQMRNIDMSGHAKAILHGSISSSIYALIFT